MIKKILLHLTILFSFSIQHAFSQQILQEYDSLTLLKPSIFKESYKIGNGSGLQEVAFKRKDIKALSGEKSSVAGSILGGALTLFTGIATEETKGTSWTSENELVFTNKDFNWKVFYFFTGHLNKSTERVKNSDGGSTVATTKTLFVNRGKEDEGIILEKGDTAGVYVAKINAFTEPNFLDSLAAKWSQKLEATSTEVIAKLERTSSSHSFNDFRMRGTLRGKDFHIITHGISLKSVLLWNNKPIAIIQNEPSIRSLSKKDRVTPYLLLDKSLTESEKTDAIRLAMLNKLVFDLARIEEYSM